MNKKFIKIIIALLLIFSLYISFVCATDTNLNLPGTSDNNLVTENTQNTETSNTVNNTENNTNNIENTDNSIQNPDADYQDNQSDLSNSQLETLSPANISSATESGLGITNIINILLITVGVILILLAIAIIIRLRN